MVKYNLEHLTQEDNQIVLGPIQDDEALFLYSIIRGCRLERILEIGGSSGYSAKNFLQAMSFSKKAVLYTCDIIEVPLQGENHKFIHKNALDLTIEDVDNQALEMIFFDCHDMVQMNMYFRFLQHNMINDNTIIVLHDTNLHYPPYSRMGLYIEEEDAFTHQPVERFMVNEFKKFGYDIFSISTDRTKHSEDFPFRHGLTICRKFKLNQEFL